MASVNPYLNFNGHCEQAFLQYQSVFGTKIEFMSRFSEMPPEHPCDPEEKEKIMHVMLPIGNGTVLMGSDVPKAYQKPETASASFAVAVAPQSAEEADRIFNGLAEGGNITMPIGKTFWAEKFGMCVDRWGVNWMVNYANQ
ncbi:PhnB protein [Chitinophaga jiangningensis]|uniref:PhnB protein n=1 Tax=Chitinophaga jiangningensis TaxID=1419482 RepID=A0A1M7LKZ7_9BACT|nr:VOC family protein [Chitinophaga jiangningensis]SHM78679.1 PhnB protein [Chitinophaga jiangningensis]